MRIDQVENWKQQIFQYMPLAIEVFLLSVATQDVTPPADDGKGKHTLKCLTIYFQVLDKLQLWFGNFWLPAFIYFWKT